MTESCSNTCENKIYKQKYIEQMVNTARCELKIDQLTIQIEELLQELNDERRIRYDMRNQIYEYEHANRILPVAACKIALAENAFPVDVCSSTVCS